MTKDIEKAKGSKKKKKDEPREAPEPPEDDIEGEDLEGEDLEEEKEEPEDDEEEEEDLEEDEDEEEEDDEEEDSDDEEEEEEGSTSGKKKDVDMSKFENIGMILGIIGLVILGIKIVVDVIGWFFSFAAWCMSCLLWPLFAFGWIPALAAVGIGVYIMITQKGKENKKAIIIIALGAAYVVLGIGWIIIDWIMRRLI